MAKCVLPAMRAAKRGAIVNIASIHACMSYPKYFPYAAAKSGADWIVDGGLHAQFA